MWVARDKNGALYGFSVKPYKTEHGVWNLKDGTGNFCYLPNDFLDLTGLPSVEWKDEEPLKVECIYE